MNSVLISIQPKWCEIIASGQKTIEVRKTKPKLKTPFKVYIYQTFHRENNGRTYSDGKVIGEFVCDEIIKAECGSYCILPYHSTQLDALDLMDYAGEKPVYGWHISDLVIYEKPKGLGEFKHCGVNYHYNPPITRPPQSWCYAMKGE